MHLIHYYMLPHIVALVGCDGSGKSTITSKLKKIYPATYIHEPYHPHIIKQINSSFSIFDKINLFAQDRYLLYSSLNFDSTIISDRSFLCSMVYQSLELETLNWDTFQSIKYIYDAQIGLIPPTLVIYIHANPDIIHHRLQTRDKSHHLSIEQIIKIQERYNYIFKLLHINVLSIDTGSTSIENNISKIISHLQ